MSWPRTRWRIPTAAPEGTRRLTEALGISPPLAVALQNRGLSEPELARHALSPNLQDLVPPEQLPGVPAADARLRRAAESGEAVLVFGDFDADGLCAASILVHALESIGCRVAVFVPDRLSEGYGLTPAAATRALQQHPETRLLVTVDCGVTQHDGCAVCATHGVEVIITDHHALPAVLPAALAIVHPHLPGTPLALRDLAGVGVAFKLAHALARGAMGHRFDPATLLPAVALGTVTDVAPLTGENRILVHAGLARLNRGRHVGLTALAKAARLANGVTATDLAFRLGPRINAAGRIGDPLLAYALLRSTDASSAETIARQLDALNAERQLLEKDTCEEANRQLAAEFDAAHHRAVVVSGTDWHPGIVGLVAGRLSHRWHLPAVAIRLGADGLARGSARCPDSDGLDLMALLEPCAHLLVRHGGHRAAAGLSLHTDQVPAFAAAFRHACATALAGIDLRSTLDIDAWIDPASLSLAFHEETQQLEPCGAGHAPARWALRALVLAEAPAPMGADGQHYRLKFRTEHGVTFGAVLFNADPPLDAFHAGDRLDIAFTTRRNDYWNTPELQLVLDDLRPATDP